MCRKYTIQCAFLILLLNIFVFESAAQNSIDVVLVEGGTFMMGSDNPNFPDEQPEHKVKVPSFYMAQYELVYDDYFAFTRNAGYHDPIGTPGMPVTRISWQRAVMLCNWLSTREGFERAYTIVRDESKGIFEVSCDFSKSGYRLPTEAEWEYAARGGNRSKSFLYSGSNSPYHVAWFTENAEGIERPSGELLPNELGIYDMSGNVAELCWDYYAPDYYSGSPEYHPKGSDIRRDRVYRGGNRRSRAEFIELTRRFSISETGNDPNLGLRIVRTKTD